MAREAGQVHTTANECRMYSVLSCETVTSLRPVLCVVALALTPAGGQTKTGPATVAPGKYHCVFFLNGALQTTPGFTIQPGSAYQHDGGTKGRYTYDPAQALLTFEGGALDKQAAHVEADGKRGIIRLYNERRSRTVIDCDTPLH